jgi:alkanesulfonate monooxygenase SsuD/methylene tetrahydromethanopterin reductase-like flavin-dependent oxidoreductase (luciferase family)
MGLALDVVVQDTHQDATELLRHPAIRELCLLQSPAVFARYGVPHPLGASLFNRLIPTLDGPRLLEAALAVPDDLVRDHVIHGTVEEVIETIRRYDGLDHIRISDLSGMVRPGGGTDRLLAIVDGLR